MHFKYIRIISISQIVLRYVYLNILKKFKNKKNDLKNV